MAIYTRNRIFEIATGVNALAMTMKEGWVKTRPYGYVIPTKRSAWRNLRTIVMPRSFDSLRSLRMTQSGRFVNRPYEFLGVP